MKRGRPPRWTAEMVEAALDLARRFGPKRAAAMCGISYHTLTGALLRHGAGLKSMRQERTQ
jgi:hypothetical protein